jgi:hypothetical protein
MNISGSPAFAKPPERYVQASESAVDNDEQFEKKV